MQEIYLIKVALMIVTLNQFLKKTNRDCNRLPFNQTFIEKQIQKAIMMSNDKGTFMIMILEAHNSI